MQGTPEDRGVNYRALQELFLLKEAGEGRMEFALTLSVLEVGGGGVGMGFECVCVAATLRVQRVSSVPFCLTGAPLFGSRVPLAAWLLRFTTKPFGICWRRQSRRVEPEPELEPALVAWKLGRTSGACVRACVLLPLLLARLPPLHSPLVHSI